MGRKIPARKHMGIKDPLRQKAEKLALIKDKINNPPEKKDFQKVSHSLARFIKAKEEALANENNKGNTKWKRKRIDNEDKPENYKNYKGKAQQNRNDKELPNIKQHQNEKDIDYLRRINRITKESIQEAQFEAKYGVEVVRNKTTGEIKLKKRPKDELETQMKENLKRNKKNGKITEPPLVLSTEEKRRLVKEVMAKKKAEKNERPIVEEYKRDEFKFGEVVQQPPTLPTPRLAQKAETVPRPGKKVLLLHSVIEQHTNLAEPNKTGKNSKTPAAAPKATTKNVGSLKGKRKDLSMAMRHMIDTEQNNVVKMYKELKKNQRKEGVKKS